MKHFLFKFTKSKNQNKMVRQCRIPDIFKNFTKFFLLVTHYFLLSKSPSVPFLWCGLVLSMCLLVLMLKVSGTLALWTWLSFLALYLLLSVCLQVPVLLSGSTLVLDPWLPCSWLVRVMEQYVVGDKLGLLLGGGLYCR